MLIVCDLDGTLADCTHREHVLPDWDAFFEDLHLDPPIEHTLWVLKALMAVPLVRLIFLTGRSEKYRPQTKLWLSQKCGLDDFDDYEALLMRPDNDYTPDFLLKLQLLKDYLQQCADTSAEDPVPMDPRRQVLILEDRAKVTIGFRNDGWTVWQVKEGTY